MAKVVVGVHKTTHKWNEFFVIKVKWLINHCNFLHFTSHQNEIGKTLGISLNNQNQKIRKQIKLHLKPKGCVFLIVWILFSYVFYILFKRSHFFIKLSNLFIEFISILPYLVAISAIKAEVQTLNIKIGCYDVPNEKKNPIKSESIRWAIEKFLSSHWTHQNMRNDVNWWGVLCVAVRTYSIYLNDLTFNFIALDCILRLF